MEFAWNDLQSELRIKQEKNDPNATYHPTAELLLGIDNFKDVNFLIPATRYTLAYKIKVVTINPFKITEYLMDANTSSIFRTREVGIKENGTCGAYGYGTNNAIDTKWFGGFSYHYRLIAEDNGRNYKTRKGANAAKFDEWTNLVTLTDSDDNWGNSYLTETSAHYFTGLCWDYYNIHGRNGFDNNGLFLQVRTQLQHDNAFYLYDSQYFSSPRLTFGKKNNYDYSWEPSIVAHEYTHGIVDLTANLVYEFESGALDESFSDIFGIVIQARMLDNNVTDWILGNHVSTLSTRSLINPNSAGNHVVSVINNNVTYGAGQPDTYLGTNFYNGNNIDVDRGGVHINSGVQNHWFYILSDGASGTNDIGDVYNVLGIGMEDAAQIAYLALTSTLQNASQYTDSRMATIQAAEALFGQCSQQHISTIAAWHAVGVGNLITCGPLSLNEVTESIKVYPNPASSVFSISTYGLNIKEDLKLYNLNGQLVKTIKNSGLMKIDISDLSSGTYIVRLNINNKVISKKLIIQSND